MKKGERDRERPQDDIAYVNASELQAYTKILPFKQKQQLMKIIQRHPEIEIGNKNSQKFYKSSSPILKEVAYIIQQNKIEMNQSNLSSFYSIESQAQLKLVSQRVKYFQINEHNYTEINRNIISLRKIDACPFQMVIKQSKEGLKATQVIVSSKCRGNRKFFFIFEHFSDLTLLQTLVDFDWKLETIFEICEQFRQTGKSKVMISINQSRQLHLLRLTEKNNWESIISHLSKNIDISTYIILLRIHLFQNLYSRSKKINFVLRVAFPDRNFNLVGFKSTRVLVYQPEIQFQIVYKLAYSILFHNSRQFSDGKESIDCVTCFNIIFLERKGCEQILILKTNKDNKKEYIYFTFYQKLCHIIIQNDRLILKQCNMKQQITSEIYRGTFDELLNFAVFNQIPFFYYCQVPSEIKKVPISKLSHTNKQDINRLLYYRHVLNSVYYKIVISQQFQLQPFFKTIKSHYQIIFDNPQILSKMGRIKSDDIVNKYRKGSTGCISATVEFCNLFVTKCCQQYLKQEL